MDNVCHTLVGAALAESGLKHRSRLGYATLLIAANLPDIDVLSLLGGSGVALGFRRGLTHGLPALVVLPIALAGLVVLWDHWSRFRTKRPDPVRPAQLLLLSYAGVITHPALDYLNVYGMRWLMPLVDRWEYGDVLFIVDPWIWALLAAGIYLSKQRAKVDRNGAGRPASAALGVVVAYIALMAVAGGAARSIVASELPRHGLNAQSRFMVAPVPLNPFRRVVVVEDRTGYRLGTFHWLPNPTVEFEDVHIARGDNSAAARLAAATDRGRIFLQWARFPFFVESPAAGGSVVYIVDARYTLDEHAGFGAVAISVERN